MSVCSARKQTDERRLKEHKRQSWSPFQKTRPWCASDQPCSFVSPTASLFVCSDVEERKEFIVHPRRRFSATRRSLPVSAEMFLPGTGKMGNLRHHDDGKDKQSLLVIPSPCLTHSKLGDLEDRVEDFSDRLDEFLMDKVN